METIKNNERNNELSIVTLEDFQSVDFLSPIADIEYVDGHSIASAFIHAADIAHNEGRDRDVRVFRLLISLCGCHFKPEDTSSPYGAQIHLSDGSRTAIPEDYIGEQNHHLSQIIPNITHPWLCARISDIVWLNNRKEKDAAKSALASYCETLAMFRNGKYRQQFDTNNPSMEEVKLLQRTLQIASTISKKDEFPENVRNIAAKLYNAAYNNQIYVSFSNLAGLLLSYKLMEPAIIAKNAEELADRAAEMSNTYPMAIQTVLGCSLRAYRQIKDKEASTRIQLKSVEQTLQMRKQVLGSASAEAHWIRNAIEELRQIPGTKDRQESLRLEMRILQEKARDEVGNFSIPIDLSDIRAKTSELFEKLILSDALYQFALISSSIPIEKLREEAIKGMETSPLLAMMGSSYFDNEGKIIAETSGVSASVDPSEEWLKKTISDNSRLNRHIVTAGSIDPARIALEANYTVSERHFSAIVHHSPFIPASQRYIFSLGFARLIQGDFVSAAHLLLPQVENSIRYVLQTSGHDSSKFMHDMIQEDRPLSNLFDNFRSELEQIFTPPIVNEIELLFIYRPGPALRHEFAHGKVSANYCFSPDVIYACWFVYRLCCLPLFPHWKEHIAPLIEKECS